MSALSIVARGVEVCGTNAPHRRTQGRGLLEIAAETGASYGGVTSMLSRAARGADGTGWSDAALEVNAADRNVRYPIQRSNRSLYAHEAFTAGLRTRSTYHGGRSVRTEKHGEIFRSSAYCTAFRDASQH